MLFVNHIKWDGITGGNIKNVRHIKILNVAIGIVKMKLADIFEMAKRNRKVKSVVASKEDKEKIPQNYAAKHSTSKAGAGMHTLKKGKGSYDRKKWKKDYE